MKLLLSFFFLLLSFLTYGQYTISGKITDKNNKPYELATVMLSKDSLAINTTITDSMGNYKISNVKQGNYSIRFSYTVLEKKITFYVEKDTIINTQLIDSKQLNEVVVSSKKPLLERKIDRLVFNVEDNLSTIGSDALDVLSKTPGVSVQESAISLIGKGSVSVMIDDRLIQLSGDDLANLLKSMSADDIASIEVITNPPAKYDAQGNSGLINIILKKNARKGYNGSLRGGYIQGIYATVFGGGNLNYNRGKFKFYSNFNMNNGIRQPILQRSIYYSTQTWNMTDVVKRTFTNLNGQLGMDYQASKNTLLGISYNGSLSNVSPAENINTTIVNEQNTIDSTLTTNASTTIHPHYNGANVYLKQSLGSSGKQITINGDWLGFANNQQRTYYDNSYLGDGQYISNSFSQYFTESELTSNIYTLKADVDLPYKKYVVGLGGKLSFIKNRSNVLLSQLLNNSYQTDTSQSDLFNYTENTQALYINANRTIKKWSFQTGLRGEYTQTTGASISLANAVQTNPPNNYFKIFPTVYISYNKDDKNVFTLNYGKRINRPGYWNLNPFRWYSNPYTYSEGNPFLQPSYTNNIEIAYTYNNIFTTSLSFNNENNRFRTVTFVQNGSDTAVTEPLNFLTGNTFLSNSSYTFNKIKWLQSIETFCMYYNDTKSTLPQTLPTITGFGTWFETENQITMNKAKTLITGVDFSYTFPAVEDINKNGVSCWLDISLKALLFDKKLQVAVNGNDLLKTGISKVYTLINGIEQIEHDYYDTRNIRVSLNYKFGNSKIKRQEHQSGNQDEQNRTN